jgi:hypothetical protein
MADTYITCTVSPCQIVTTLDVPVLNLDESGGALIASAILAVWAMGYGIRAVIRALNSDGVSTSESE